MHATCREEKRGRYKARASSTTASTQPPTLGGTAPCLAHLPLPWRAALARPSLTRTARRGCPKQNPESSRVLGFVPAQAPSQAFRDSATWLVRPKQNRERRTALFTPRTPPLPPSWSNFKRWRGGGQEPPLAKLVPWEGKRLLPAFYVALRINTTFWPISDKILQQKAPSPPRPGSAKSPARPASSPQLLCLVRSAPWAARPPKGACLLGATWPQVREWKGSKLGLGLGLFPSLSAMRRPKVTVRLGRMPPSRQPHGAEGGGQGAGGGGAHCRGSAWHHDANGRQPILAPPPLPPPAPRC